RRVELIAKQHISRTGRGAEPAMHAGTQDLFRRCDLRIHELRGRERSLHRHTPADMRPGLRTPFGSKLSLTRLARARRADSSGANTSIAARPAAGARISVACPPTAATALRIAAASGSSGYGIATQMRPPAQS